jgi:hypothetical protein
MEPQPKGGERLTEIPEMLYGKWFGDNHGWQINKNGFTYIEIESDSVGIVLDTTYQTISLSDTFRIYKAKELYIIHTKENSDYWEIIILRHMKNGDINAYQASDPELFKPDKGLKLERANFYIDGEEKSVKTLNPEHEESLSFQSAVFSGQMKMRTLRKVLTPDNLIVLTKDGSIYNPNVNNSDVNVEEE